MCGRFNLRTPASQWCQLLLPQIDLDLEQTPESTPRYNIAPTQAIDCVMQESVGAPRIATKVRWGLIPSWAKDAAIGSRLINARSETIDSKPSFRRAFASRRCLIPADGYYEWKKVADGKQPFLIERRDGGLLAMAGLWEENLKIAEDHTPIRSCTVITTEANQTTSGIHHRMPVILRADDYDRWLDPGFHDGPELKSLLGPAKDDLLKVTPVSRHVNSPRNDDEECVAPVELNS